MPASPSGPKKPVLPSVGRGAAAANQPGASGPIQGMAAPVQAAGLTASTGGVALPKVSAQNRAVKIGQGVLYPSISALEMPQVLAACSATGRALYVHGAAGIGKSEVAAQAGANPMVKEIAWKQWQAETGGEIPRVEDGSYPDLEMVMLTLPQHEAEDFVGVPYHKTLSEDDKVTAFAPVDAFRKKYPTVLFLDEVSAAEVRTMKAVLQIVNERKIANVNLTPGTVIILAGNRAEDRAAIRSVPFTLGNRAAHYEMVVDDEAWLQWAEGSGVAGPFRAYVKQHGVRAIHDYDQANPMLSQLTPRSFAAAAFGYQAGEEMGFSQELLESLLLANIGPENGTKLGAYLRLNHEVPSWEDLCRDPQRARLPDSVDKIYYTMGMLIDNIRSPKFIEEQKRAVYTYLDRVVKEVPSATDAVGWLITEAVKPNPAKGNNSVDVQFVFGMKDYPDLAKRMGNFMTAVRDAIQE